MKNCGSGCPPSVLHSSFFILRYDSDMTSLEQRIKQQAHALGFELAGIAPAAPADSFDRLRDWLDRGFAGDMTYLDRHGEARRHPSSVLPQVRSVVMVAMNYKPDDRAGPPDADAPGPPARVR